MGSDCCRTTPQSAKIAGYVKDGALGVGYPIHFDHIGANFDISEILASFGVIH